MKSKDVKWLPHLENSIPESIRGYSAGFYSIALEGWRRGLTLKFINNNRSKANILYELSNDEKCHRFTGSRGDLVTKKAINICINKQKTKEYLEKSNVSTPDGRFFTNENKDQELIKYANEKGYPLVLKPSNGARGDGVVAGIQNEEELKEAIHYVREQLNFKNIIIEEYFNGEDYRVYVVGEEVVAVTKRLPANIIGNGKQTIRELIAIKNQLRSESPILGASLIKIDKELKQKLEEKHFTLDSVPKDGELVTLKSKNNISTGGDPVDVTDEIPNEIKKIALDARKAIPNLPQAGVDLMVDMENNKAVVIEINTQPSIRTHIFPNIGKARDIPKKIIDLYFPETQNISYQPIFNFEFEPIWELIRKGYVQEVTVPNTPLGNVGATRFVISGVLDYSKFSKNIQKKIKFFNLHGYMLLLKNKNVSIIIAGEIKNIKSFKEELYSERYNNLVINEKIRKSPVKVGFLKKQI